MWLKSTVSLWEQQGGVNEHTHKHKPGYRGGSPSTHLSQFLAAETIPTVNTPQGESPTGGQRGEETPVNVFVAHTVLLLLTATRLRGQQTLVSAQIAFSTLAWCIAYVKMYIVTDPGPKMQNIHDHISFLFCVLPVVIDFCCSVYVRQCSRGYKVEGLAWGKRWKAVIQQRGLLSSFMLCCSPD